MKSQVVVVMGASVDGRITTAPGRDVGEWAAERLNAVIFPPNFLRGGEIFTRRDSRQGRMNKPSH